MKKEIEFVVREQEKLDLDVLVHGEAERNDMVELFRRTTRWFCFHQIWLGTKLWFTLRETTSDLR